MDNNSKKTILVPKQSLLLPTTPAEQRMREFRSKFPPPNWPSEGGATIRRLKSIEEGNLAVQEMVQAFSKQVSDWQNMHYFMGSGLVIANTLRSYAEEYNNRILTTGGPDSMPSSFNIAEAFMDLNDKYMLLSVKDEIEHLIESDAYFEWYTNDGISLHSKILFDAMKEGVVYSYNFVGTPESYKVATENSFLCLAGFAMIRHKDELSCILVAGENPPFPSDDEIMSGYEHALRTSQPLSGRELIAPHPDLTTADRYLSEFPGFSRVVLLTRFDLNRWKHTVRYINVDYGISYNVFFDDINLLEELSREMPTERMVDGLSRYQDLYSACAALIFLPIFAVDLHDRFSDRMFKTQLFSMADEPHVKTAIDRMQSTKPVFERNVKCLRVQDRSMGSNKKAIDPPDFSFQEQGYWMDLPNGQIGQDYDGNPIVGKTWAIQHVSWSVQSPERFVLSYETDQVKGMDPGLIYIMRSSAHEPGVYKIGLTRRNTVQRAKELSNTSAPLPFGVLAHWEVGDCREAEKRIHIKLAYCRINPRREFFSGDLKVLTGTIYEILTEMAD